MKVVLIRTLGQTGRVSVVECRALDLKQVTAQVDSDPRSPPRSLLPPTFPLGEQPYTCRAPWTAWLTLRCLASWPRPRPPPPPLTSLVIDQHVEVAPDGNPAPEAFAFCIPSRLRPFLSGPKARVEAFPQGSPHPRIVELVVPRWHTRDVHDGLRRGPAL